MSSLKELEAHKTAIDSFGLSVTRKIRCLLNGNINLVSGSPLVPIVETVRNRDNRENDEGASCNLD